MRAVLHKEISPDTLRREIGDVPDITALLDRLYGGRLSDRNRSMVVLASHRGLTSGTVRNFLGIDKHTHRKYLRTLADGGHAALFAHQTKSNRKFDNDAIKQAMDSCMSRPQTTASIARRGSCPICRGSQRSPTPCTNGERAELIDRKERFTFLKLGKNTLDVVHLLPVLGVGRRQYLPGPSPAVTGCLVILRMTSGQAGCPVSRRLSKLSQEYKHKSRIYLSWDAASWHMSKMLMLVLLTITVAPGEMPTVPQRQKSKGSLIMTTAGILPLAKVRWRRAARWRRLARRGAGRASHHG